MSFSSLGDNSSGPLALDGLICCSCFSTPCRSIDVDVPNVPEKGWSLDVILLSAFFIKGKDSFYFIVVLYQNASKYR